MLGWILTFLVIALIAGALGFGGIAGAYLSGLATDRWFGGRRAPVICLLLILLGLLSLAYDYVIHWGLGASLLVLFSVGFCIFGPQVLLVGTLPSDLARSGTAAAAAAAAASFDVAGSAGSCTRYGR